MITSRRRFFLGASASLIAAPAIVRVAANLMPVSTRAIRSDMSLLNVGDIYRFQGRNWIVVGMSHGEDRHEGALHSRKIAGWIL